MPKASVFIGTTDNKDLVFRTQGTERFRLLANGEVKVANLQFSSGYSLLFADSTGTLRSAIGYADEIQEVKHPCPVPWPWLVCGNTINPDHFFPTITQALNAYQSETGAEWRQPSS